MNIIWGNASRIALFDALGNIFAVIEVVVTHKPEKHILEYYKDNKIVLIQYVLTDDLDLINIDSKLANPDLVSICFNQKCNECSHYLHKLKMMIIDASCYRCGSDLKCAIIHSLNSGCIREHGSHLNPEKFIKEEINFAHSKGVVLKKRYSKTLGYAYLANTCNKCDAFIGNHFLFRDYVSQVDYGDVVSNEYDIGYHCEYCSIKRAEESWKQLG